MNVVKQIKKVKNHKVEITLPEDFDNKEVEIIVSELVLNNDVSEKKLWSRLSEMSIKKLWDNREDDVYNDLL